MAYFRVLTPLLAQMNTLFHRNEDWVILINADPDALACAMALKALMNKKVGKVTIAAINSISRPDNLAMIKHLSIPVKPWTPDMENEFQRFAIVDSQPHHHPIFSRLSFSIIIDHHHLPEPYAKEEKKKNLLVSEKEEKVDKKVNPCEEKPISTFCNLEKNKEEETLLIHAAYGAASTIFTELLYNAGIKIKRKLATALQYGIRTDTGTFGRNCTEVDLRAYHYLSRFADPALMTSIIRSEYLPEWLPYFSKAFDSIRPCGLGRFTFLGQVSSPDILVVIADFFLRVHGLRYIIINGIYDKKVISIFRGTEFDLGQLAIDALGEFGSAGGHKNMARAETPIKVICSQDNMPKVDFRCKKPSPELEKALEDFIFQRLKLFGTKKNLK